MISTRRLSLAAVLLAVLCSSLFAQPVNPSLYQSIKKKVAALEGRTAGLDFFGVSNREPGLAGLSNGFLSLMNLVEGADVMPTTQAIAAADELQRSLTEVLARWAEIKRNDVPTLNDQLRQAGLPAIAN